MINSLWGKLAVKPGKPQTQYVTEPDEFHAMLRNDEFDISDIMHVSPEMLLVTYLLKGKRPSISMVTSYARCWLFNKCIAKLEPWQIHYVDTDSIIYSRLPEHPELPTGNGLGELTNELSSMFGDANAHIGVWCATGNKSYAFMIRNNPQQSVVKVKGFTLGLSANKAQDINMEQMVQMVLEHPHTTLEITQPPLFVKDKQHAKISSQPRVKLFQYNYNNKVLLPCKKMKPYGFVGNFPSASQ